MGMKRKLVDDASLYSHCAKQMKLVPFPSSEPSSDADMDVAMSDEPVMGMLFAPAFHSRHPSSASESSDSEYSSYGSTVTPAYPAFDLYPAPDPASRANSLNSRAFSGLGFSHLRPGCKQIPKLRVACGSGPSGQRSMWGLCEECGAVQILDS